MKRILLTAAVLCFIACPALADDDLSVDSQGHEAYIHPIPQLTEPALGSFYRGRSLFHQIWVVTPSLDTAIQGLGPLYNQFSCSACHANNGGGNAPDGPDERMRSMLVRLSVPGEGPHGGPLPTPAYGDQLNEQGIPAVPGEGRVEVHWKNVAYNFPDGERIMLRRPVYRFVDLAYGALHGFLYSPRVAPPVIGDGLLDAVPDKSLIAFVQTSRPDGVKGRVNLVWDVKLQRATVGRFGWKANVPTLRQQIAGAFNGDMGITSTLFPAQNCTTVQTACLASPALDRTELSDAQLDDVERYVASLAVPACRNADHAEVKSGEALFSSIGCAACHLTSLTTGASERFPQYANRVIHPYTDLLLHDMGKELADGRPDYLASGREWRTPPLWGIGLAHAVNPRAGFLHDGRARNLQESILWHGGEAQISRDRYARLTRAERKALLAFLQSL